MGEIIKQKIENYFDCETGEVVDTRIEPVKSASHNFMWDEEKGYRFFNKNNSVRMYDAFKLRKLIKDKNDLMKILLLTQYVTCGTNRIYYEYEVMTKFGTIKIERRLANVDEISEILGLCEKRTRLFLSRVQKLGVLAEMQIQTLGKTYFSGYAFNPAYVNACTFIPLDLYLTFQEALEDSAPMWAKMEYNRKYEEMKNKIKGISENNEVTNS